MAWRIADWVTHGEWDNRQRGRVFGRLWLAARKEPLVVELVGNAWRDLAGCVLAFRRRDDAPAAKAAPGRATLAPLQRGVAGDLTASRRVKVPAIPADELDDRLRLGLDFPTRLANCLYLEWYSEANGRVVMETTEFDLQISTPVWMLSAAEERRQRAALVRLKGRGNWAVEVRSRAVRNRAVSNRNCVVATRGGEQRNENDQSVTQVARVGGRRELDSVGVAGRAC